MSQCKKKNKLGDMDLKTRKITSTEEPSLSNVADNKVTWSNEEEPTLTEIKNILVGLQTSVSKILIEIRTLKWNCRN